MQYLLLIYENEKRFATGYDPAEMKEYMAFNETYGTAINKEQLGGYYLVEANNLDDAIEMAGKIPGARSGCVEVRPIETFS